MTQDDVIRLAREAGFTVTHIGDPIGTSYDMIEAFAKLVAAEVKDALDEQHMDDIWQAIKIEREACAKVCEAERILGIDDERAYYGELMATAIRARGQQ